jgi:4-hydroxybenzoate polyprenyltransferase
MKLFLAFLRLVRWPNLLFIVLTQYLFVYAVIMPRFQTGLEDLAQNLDFILLVTSSVLIAAAGYIINDYFDLNIDSVNKPQKLVIDKLIKRRWAIMLHILMSLAGIGIGIFIDFHLHTFWVGLANGVCVLLLFGYSISLKKKPLIGNVVISLLTGWVIMVVYFFQASPVLHPLVSPGLYNAAAVNSITRIAFLYGGFAFVISLVREVLKDLEDMEGDARYGCRTLPIAWGVPACKVFSGVWIIVLIAVLAIVQFYVIRFGWWWSIAYGIPLIILPLLWILRGLRAANVPEDYRRLSATVKWVMLTGILSMVFFKIYS